MHGVQVEGIDDEVVLLLLTLVEYQVNPLAKHLHVGRQCDHGNAAGIGHLWALGEKALHLPTEWVLSICVPACVCDAGEGR